MGVHFKIHETFHKRIFCENWTYVKHSIEKSMFSKKFMGNGYGESCLKMGRSSLWYSKFEWQLENFPILRQDLLYHGKFWKYGVFNGAFHICPIFTKIFSCEIYFAMCFIVIHLQCSKTFPPTFRFSFTLFLRINVFSSLCDTISQHKLL